ncbi:MAG TPA: membrane protein insertase YidC [Spirochaetales bacterium]|nr:membrane protein insertase YidC [Spirochaetales bacterium]
MSNIYDNNPKGDKRTLIAVVLSVIVITAGFMIQGALFPPAAKTAVPAAPAAAASPQPAQAPAAAPAAASAVRAAQASPAAAKDPASAAIEAPLAERSYTISTDLLEAVFTNRGGDLVSLKLKKHKDKNGAVDLVVAGDAGSGGLSVAFGPYGTAPVSELMNARMIDEKTIEFSRTFVAELPGKPEGQSFVYKKAYSLRDGEYLFGMAITLENSVNEYLPLDRAGAAYTVTMGPQIGPRLSDLSKNARADFRKYITYSGGKKREEKVKPGIAFVPKEQPTWVALSGKYFSFVAVPELAGFTPTFLTEADPAVVQKNLVALSRPAIKASAQTDSYYFYFGPKTNAELSKYDYADRNAFGRSGFNLEQAMDSSGMLTWLENILKFCLKIFYKLTPNYGVAIILVTILVKAVMFPLTKKGSIASAKMQEYQPQIQELQAKYKANPQKLNMEMAEFYKREGYNPMSGCLPLLIQFPIFIAMYNLFNNHFDLRGALFIPGWIPDLSQPEAIYSFAPINLFVFKLSAIRVLPVIYLLSQLFYGKFTQTQASGQTAAQMKFMMYGMPIMFFFILYDVPSGLLIYWIFSNLIQIAQQVVINDILKKRKLELAAAGGAPAGAKLNKIAPNKGKGKKK